MTRRREQTGSQPAEAVIDVVASADLTAGDVARLRRLFDVEYRQSFGEWDPDLPYGYAPHDVHVIARQENRVVGHVGWARRAVGVGDRELVIAGVGGVLISDHVRGRRLGERLMKRVAETMVDAGGIAFGYLGCREDVTSFYIACGWTRISAAERFIDRSGRLVEAPPGPPLLILPIESPATAWPIGTIDLRGRAW